MNEKFLNLGCPIIRATKFNPINYAVINAYIDTNIGATTQKLGVNSGSGNGGVLKRMVNCFVVGSTDAAGSIYRVFKGVSPDAVIQSVRLYNDALTGASSVKCGLYGVLDYDLVGAIVGTGDQFASAVDISAGNPVTSTPLVFDKALSIANRNQPLFVVAGHTVITKLPAYDICLTMTAMTTGATGNVCLIIDFVQM